MAKLIPNGKYGQVELNQVAFRRDGHVEAQAACSTVDFPRDAKGNYTKDGAKCENGMLLAVDKANNEVKFAVNSSLPIALVYSAEHMYDERHNGSLGEFYLGVDGGDFYPRLGYLTVGDIFMTNCVDASVVSTASIEAGALTSAEKVALKSADFGAGTNGYITDASPVFGPKLKVINDETERGGWTMPDGSIGIKFQVIA